MVKKLEKYITTRENPLKRLSGAYKSLRAFLALKLDIFKLFSYIDPKGSDFLMENKIILGDCVAGMRGLKNESVDLIVTDPPYLIRYKTNHRKNKNHEFCTEIANDDNEQLIRDYIRECYRILKKNSAMYMFCSSKTQDFFTKELEDAKFKIKNRIVWVKNNWTAGDLQAQFGQQYELIFLVNKGRKFFNGKRLSDVWFFDRVAGKEQIHQNQKPIPLIEQCIEKHSKKGDLVFDGFMGVGTTALAASNLDRRYLGFEIEPKYYDLAIERTDVNADA